MCLWLHFYTTSELFLFALPPGIFAAGAIWMCCKRNVLRLKPLQGASDNTQDIRVYIWYMYVRVYGTWHTKCTVMQWAGEIWKFIWAHNGAITWRLMWRRNRKKSIKKPLDATQHKHTYTQSTLQLSNAHTFSDSLLRSATTPLAWFQRTSRHPRTPHAVCALLSYPVAFFVINGTDFMLPSAATV